MNMKACIVSYSMSGNNKVMAESVARELGMDHIIIEESSKRTMFRVIVDMIFGVTPKIKPTVESISKYDLVIMFGPIWMEKVASPLRAFMKYIKKTNLKYAFVTISGGALHKNPKLINDLRSRTGSEPEILYDQYVSDLIDIENPTMKDTGSYKLTKENLDKLSQKAIEVIANYLEAS